MKFLLTGLLFVKIVLIVQLSATVLGLDLRFFGNTLAYSQEKKTESQAEQPKEKEKSEADKQAPPPKENPEAGNQAEQAKEEAEAESAMVAKEKTAASQEVKIALESLEKKRLEIQEAEKRLGDERKRLEDLKQEIAAQIESLAKVNQQLDDKLKVVENKDAASERGLNEAEEKKLRQLVKVYANMKPKEAAPIIDRLDIEVAEKIFLRMKGEQAGQILAYVNKERAAKISERLAAENKNRKKTP